MNHMNISKMFGEFFKKQRLIFCSAGALEANRPDAKRSSRISPYAPRRWRRIWPLGDKKFLESTMGYKTGEGRRRGGWNREPWNRANRTVHGLARFHGSRFHGFTVSRFHGSVPRFHGSTVRFHGSTVHGFTVPRFGFTVPRFRGSTVSRFGSTVPQFHGSTVPRFGSTVSRFHGSTVPRFHGSVPRFHGSTVPRFSSTVRRFGSTVPRFHGSTVPRFGSTVPRFQFVEY